MTSNKQRDIKKYLLGGIVSTSIIVAALMFCGDIFAGIYLEAGKGPVSAILSPLFDEAGQGTFNMYFCFLFMWVVVAGLLALIKPWRRYLKVLWTAPSGNTPKMLCVGLGIGLAMNAACILVAVACGNINGFEFVAFQPVQLIILLIVVLIQSSYEEMVLRGFAYQRTARLYGPTVGIIVSSVLFGAMHFSNAGFTLVAFLSIAAQGVLLGFAVRYFDSMWMPFGIHTGWNFCQAIIFGLPNSGSAAGYSILKPIGDITNGFAWDSTFGVEGTFVAVIVICATAVILYAWGKRHPRPCYNIFEEAEAKENVPQEA